MGVPTSLSRGVAAKLANLGEGRPGKTAPIGAVSQDDAVDMLHVARRSVQRAVLVREKGIPELIAAVERDDMAVSLAAGPTSPSKSLP